MLKIRPRAAPEGPAGQGAAAPDDAVAQPANRFMSGKPGGMPAPRRNDGGNDADANQPAAAWWPPS